MVMKQIKVTDDIKAELDVIRDDKETYNLVIQRLIREWKRLTVENRSLHRDKTALLKIMVGTDDSIAFPNISHYVYFLLPQIFSDDFYSDETKLHHLKILFKPLLEKESDVDDAIEWLEDFKLEYDFKHDIIDELILWINENYK